MKRRGSKLAVEEVLFHCGLDRRPGIRPDRTMMTLNCRWMDESHHDNELLFTRFHETCLESKREKCRVARALWPRETPKMMMVVDGDISLAAATCPPAAVIDDLFKTEVEAQEGVNSPEPGVAIDRDRQLDGTRFGSAYARWRQQWVDRITLHPWQEDVRPKLPHAAFARKVRSWFEAWLGWCPGNRHVARPVRHQ